MKRGVLYIVWGDKIEPQLKRSKESLRRFYPDMPIHVVRGQNLPQRSLQQKTAMGSLTPFESTLFLDADTVVMGNLNYAFERAEEYGLACALCECPWARRYGPAEGDNLEYNTGVIFFTAKAQPVFDAWRQLAPACPATSVWQTTDGSLRGLDFEDQASFARAVRASGWNPFILPLNYNFRPLFYSHVFAPLKIWHSPADVPAHVAEITAAVESGQRPVSYIKI
jgi:hypothetical protein